MRRRTVLIITTVLVLPLLAWLMWPSQEGDPTFDERVRHPAYPAGSGPRVWKDNLLMSGFIAITASVECQAAWSYSASRRPRFVIPSSSACEGG